MAGPAGTNQLSSLAVPVRRKFSGTRLAPSRSGCGQSIQKGLVMGKYLAIASAALITMAAASGPSFAQTGNNANSVGGSNSAAGDSMGGQRGDRLNAIEGRS